MLLYRMCVVRIRLIARQVILGRTGLPHAEHVRPELTTPSAASSSLLHHLLHLAELLQQPIDLAHRATRAPSHARSTRPVHDARALTLGWRHREHNRLDVLHALRIRG